MNENNEEVDILEDHLGPDIFCDGIDAEPSILDHHHTGPLTLPPMSEIVFSRDEDYANSDDGDEIGGTLNVFDSAVSEHINDGNPNYQQNPRVHPPIYINPEHYISGQFYTFNGQSHNLMIRCLLDGRLAVPNEIRAVTSPAVLTSWRLVWKDRNEDTAYLTAWKRIQEKLSVHVDTYGNEYLYFKNNSNQFVSHFNQWQDIVMNLHGDADLKHLSLKETIERIKQVWTVGAKLYGIPEPFIRACISQCPVCSGSSGSTQRNKRKRFEYTESFEFPAKEVQQRLHQLAAKHKVVLCIRQKYIRYKPFMAEVKDYACHRAGDPASKKSRVLKKEPYASKRCGCGFRIRAIVPIANYNEKDKSFIYQEDGLATFKLFAVHSGHEPGPLDGNARIIHRVLGHKQSLLLDHDTVYGISEETGDLRGSVTQQIQELKNILGSLESNISNLPDSFLSCASRDLREITNKLRTVGEYHSEETFELVPDNDDIMVGEDELMDWDDQHPHELIEEGEDSFGRTLEEVVAWDEMRVEKDLVNSSKPEGWLNCEASKLRNPLGENGNVESDVGTVGIAQVDNFYQDTDKWYDPTCGLDSEADCGDSGLKDGADF